MSAPTVRLRHPTTGGEFDAPEAAVDTYARAGWEPVDQGDTTPAEPRYDTGGLLPPGTVPAANTTSEPERVLTAEQIDQPTARRRKPKEDS